MTRTRRISRLVPLIVFHLFLLLLLVDSSSACGPGRGAGRRRVPRKLTPLVYKQHAPNVGENSLSASGLHEGKINRDHARFKALVPNYNSDIIFRDDEGTGADRLMTQRMKEKLNTLAISVMNQWPGVRLRVIEGWDEGSHHGGSSLHYEGRAVDITTSDKDRSKYGMLARLAVESGFDWVYYESRAHIHCSVKSDSSQAARTGGCFTENATVITPEGKKKITEIRAGDSILSVNNAGEQVFSEVLMFLDRNATETREFFHIKTLEGTTLSLTPSHLIYRIDSLTGDELFKSGLPSAQVLVDTAEITFAKRVLDGDWLVISGKDGLKMEKVVQMESTMETGVFAPLTKEGNVVVDGVLSSCYAVINDQSLAHWAFAPVRFLVNVYEGTVHAWKQLSRFLTFRLPLVRAAVPVPSPASFQVSQASEMSSTNSVSADSFSNSHLSNSKLLSVNSRESRQQGVHWYASLLYSTCTYFIPKDLLYT